MRAAEAVCSGAGIEQQDVLGLLIQLVRKSLVVAEVDRVGSTRYRLLETLRQYAHERVRATTEERWLRKNHASYFVAFQDALCPQGSPSKRWLRGTGSIRWANLEPRTLDQLELEQDNLRAALRWSVESGQGEDAARLAEALFQVDETRGSSTEGCAWLQALLRAPTVTDTPGFHQRVLPLLAARATRSGDVATAVACLREQLAACRSAGDPLGIGNALCALATVHFDQGDYTTASTYLEQCKEVASRLDDKQLDRNWRTTGAQIALCQGRLDAARRLIDGAIACIDVGHPGWGYNQKDLARVVLEQGAYPEARILLANSLQVAEQFGDKLLLACTLEGVAGLAAALGHHSHAVSLEGASAAVHEAMGEPMTVSATRLLDRRLAVSRAALPSPETRAAWTAGHALSVEESIAYAGEMLAVLPARAATTDKQRSPTPAPNRLTRREREVAALVARGLSNGQIAEQLVISQRTVSAHIEHILNKLAVVSRTQVGVWAAEHHLVTSGTT
jgi:DNA-binding CsgD family transcriptional regulator